MSQARALSSEDISGLRAELAGGATPTVWFTASAVGVEQGRSGKVTALDDPAEGDFIQVRPAGSKDVLSFSAGEVTVVKPARKRKDPNEQSAAAKSAPVSTKSSSSTASTKSPSTAAPAKPSTASTKSPAEPGSSGRTEPKSGSASTPAEARTSGGTARRKPAQPTGATVTLTAGSEGQWSVEVSNGRKRVLRPTQVSASAVAHAAKALHADVAEAVEPLLEAAREQQRTRVEQLQRELSEAQRMLDDLG